MKRENALAGSHHHRFLSFFFPLSFFSSSLFIPRQLCRYGMNGRTVRYIYHAGEAGGGGEGGERIDTDLL